MPTSFKEPKSSILDAAFSVDDDDEVAKTQGLFGEMKQPLHKLNVHPSHSHSSCIILRSKLLYRVYLIGYMTERRKWLHWLVLKEQLRRSQSTCLNVLRNSLFKQQVICSLRQRLSDQDQKHKDVITQIHGIGSLFRFVSIVDADD